MFFNLSKSLFSPITITLSFLLIFVVAVGKTFATFSSDSIAIILTPYLSLTDNSLSVLLTHSRGALTLIMLCSGDISIKSYIL